MTLNPSSNIILSGMFVGVLSGILVGILTIISDGVFYSRYVSDFRLARKYSNPLVQLVVFMLINLFYAGLQGAIFALLLPFLPTGWFLRGFIFGGASYLVLSRHFAEGFAFMSANYFPVHLSLYLTVEFLVIYLLQAILISAGMLMLVGV